MGPVATTKAGKGNWLGVAPLRFFGDISYSFYLWHWPVFVFLAIELPNGGWLIKALARIGKLRPTITIVANSSRHTIDSAEEARGLDAAGWKEATERMLAALAGRSAATVVIRDTPWPPFNTLICLSRAAWRHLDADRTCEFDPTSETGETIFEIESAALVQAERSFMLDMTDLICPGAPCAVERDGFILYRDSHHLTVRFVEHLAESLHARIRPIMERAQVFRQNEKKSGS